MVKTLSPGRRHRQSNIELLRIVSMFLVLMVHYIPFRGEVTANSLRGGYLGVLLNLELRSLTFVCVNCFILISGYFGIKWKWRSLWNYLYQVMFWTVLAYFVAIAIGTSVFDIKQFGWVLKHLFPIIGLNCLIWVCFCLRRCLKVI